MAHMGKYLDKIRALFLYLIENQNHQTVILITNRSQENFKFP